MISQLLRRSCTEKEKKRKKKPTVQVSTYLYTYTYISTYQTFFVKLHPTKKVNHNTFSDFQRSINILTPPPPKCRFNNNKFNNYCCGWTLNLIHCSDINVPIYLYVHKYLPILFCKIAKKLIITHFLISRFLLLSINILTPPPPKCRFNNNKFNIYYYWWTFYFIFISLSMNAF
jgi:hypothetical protein